MFPENSFGIVSDVNVSVHLIKLAVGVEDVAHLARIQKARIAHNVESGLGAYHRHVTRRKPRRETELVDGGSLYWVIKGQVRVRQRILGIESFTDEHGVSRCAIVLDPDLIATRLLPHRPFQGWRYLACAKAPPDRVGDPGDTDIPEAMAEDLRALGLL